MHIKKLCVVTNKIDVDLQLKINLDLFVVVDLPLKINLDFSRAYVCLPATVKTHSCNRAFGTINK
jgi:hypothetical protein